MSCDPLGGWVMAPTGMALTRALLESESSPHPITARAKHPRGAESLILFPEGAPAREDPSHLLSPRKQTNVRAMPTNERRCSASRS